MSFSIGAAPSLSIPTTPSYTTPSGGSLTRPGGIRLFPATNSSTKVSNVTELGSRDPYRTTTLTTPSLGDTGYLGTGVNFNDYVNKMKDLAQWQLGIDKQAMGNAYDFRNREATRDYGFQTGLAGQQITNQQFLQGRQLASDKTLKGMDITNQQYLQGKQLFSDKELKSMDIASQKELQQMGIVGQKELQGQQIEGTSNLERLRNEYMNQRQSEQLQNQRKMQETGFSQQNKLLADNSSRAKSLFFR